MSENSPVLNPIDEILLSEAKQLQPKSVAIIDAPDLVGKISEIVDQVRIWCDDWRAAVRCDPQLLVDHPAELGGVEMALSWVPKSLAALDEQAASVQGHHNLSMVTAGRIRHLNRSMNQVMGRYFTAVNATLGYRKCRGIRGFGPIGHESEWPKVRNHPDFEILVAAHGATFAGNKIDPGTRLLLENIAINGEKVLDLGSGNGVIAAYLAKSGLQVAARDVSWSAVAATAETAELNELDIDISWADGLSGYQDDSFDAIVTNPPFHQGIAKESSDTLSWFEQAGRVLRPGGEFWCVFNSHLPWRKALNVKLGRTEIIAQNNRYTLTRTIAN